MAQFEILSTHMFFGGGTYNISSDPSGIRYWRDMTAKMFKLKVTHNSSRSVIYKKRNDDGSYTYRLLGNGTIDNMSYQQVGNTGYQVTADPERFTDLEDPLCTEYINNYVYWDPTIAFGDDSQGKEGTNVTFNTRHATSTGKVYYTYYNSRWQNVQNVFHPCSYNDNTGTITNDEESVTFGKCYIDFNKWGASEQTDYTLPVSHISSYDYNSPHGAHSNFHILKQENGQLVFTDYFKKIFRIASFGDKEAVPIGALSSYTYYSGWAYANKTGLPDGFTHEGVFASGHSSQTNGRDYLLNIQPYECTSATENVSEHVPYDNLIFLGILVTENWDQAKKYVEDGTIPTDAQYTDPDSKPDDPTPTPTPDDGVGSDVNPQTQTKPQKSGTTSGSTRYFLLHEQALRNFLNWFWDPDLNIVEIIQNWYYDFYGDMTQFFIGVYYFPIMKSCYSGGEDSKEIIIGRFGSGVHAGAINDEPDLFEIGYINTSDSQYGREGNFLDLEPYTSYNLYLPYVGIVDLPTNMLNQYPIIHVTAVVDVMTQQLKYVVLASSSTEWKSGVQIYETSVPFGDCIPLTLQSGLENAAKFAEAVTNTAIGAATGGLRTTTAISTLSNFHNVDTKPSMIGNGNGVMGKWGAKKCMLIVEKTVPREPSNYSNVIGYPLYETRNVNDLKGFAVFENPIIEFGNTTSGDTVVYPLSSEIDEIKSLLEGGIYL